MLFSRNPSTSTVQSIFVLLNSSLSYLGTYITFVCTTHTVRARVFLNRRRQRPCRIKIMTRSRRPRQRRRPPPPSPSPPEKRRLQTHSPTCVYVCVLWRRAREERVHTFTMNMFTRCQMHSALDVLLCTASILNICLISLDRYWSITRAVEYLKFRSETAVTVMICAVWFLSFLVGTYLCTSSAIKPLLGGTCYVGGFKSWFYRPPLFPLQQQDFLLNGLYT